MVMGYWREWGESSTGDNGVSSSAGEMYKCVMSVCQKDDIIDTSSQKEMFIMHLYSSILVMTFTLV